MKWIIDDNRTHMRILAAVTRPARRRRLQPHQRLAAFSLLTPISLAIATLLLIVIVANDNLGIRTGTVAASALLIDYALTVCRWLPV